MRVVSAQEMRQIEEAAFGAGTPYEEMMERAGRAVAEVVRTRAPQGSSILVLVGPGNNGGDGLVAARHLRLQGYAVQVCLWRRDEGPDPNLERCQRIDVPVWRWADDPDGIKLAAATRQCDIVIDALLGTGAGGPLRGGLPDLLGCVARAIGERRGHGHQAWASVIPVERSGDKALLVVAVDLPSGLNADTGEFPAGALAADITVSFACAKHGHIRFPGAAAVGELLVADIGIAVPAGEIELALVPDVATWLPARPPEGHKGTFGKALIVAGSTLYTGAPCLAAEAAYRCGAGLVTLAVPGPIHGIVASKLTESTFLLLPSNMGAIAPEATAILSERLPGYDALLVGPGLGTEKSTGAFLEALLGEPRAAHRPIGFQATPSEAKAAGSLPPLVIDADGLNLLARRERWWEGLPHGTILTPHPGEMARLCRCGIEQVQADRLGAAREAAKSWGCCVVLKGAFTIVASPDASATILPFANPALATAGTGDVLAGLIVGLLAQGLEPHRAAVCGAYLHGLAGELLRRDMGDAGGLASELLPRLPLALRRLRSA